MKELIIDPLYSRPLEGGIEWSIRDHLDGGGEAFYPSVLSAIERVKKYPYARGFEWCSGAGFLGYSLLSLGIAHHFTFQDIYEVAVDVCRDTVKNNNLEDKVEVYLSGTIGDIPQTLPWDLVVSNPPHSWDKASSISSLLKAGVPKEAIENTLRLLVDDDMEIHREFFKNIGTRLSPDADLFIIEHDQHVKDIYIYMGESNGFDFKGLYPCLFETEDRGHKIYHFKPAA